MIQEVPVASQSGDNVVEEQQENLTFGDTNPAPAVETVSILDRTRFVRDDSIAHLGAYLSRPVLINTFTWTQATSGLEVQQFYPWKAFFSDGHITAKLNNFARIQCRLRLKFILNASPFYYGLLKVNYDPLSKKPQEDGSSIIVSQMPGVYIAPQDMSSVELLLPFFWPRDYLDICSQEDFQAMGSITYSVFEQLQSANAVVNGQITISCYAWAEDIHLAAPTSKNALQGPVAEVSGKISRVAGALSAIPPLSTIGSAISTGAGMVSSLATALGFSNSPNMSDVGAVQIKTTHAFANTEQKMPLDKLALDPANEVVLSPETTGLGGVDELAVSEFVGHEAWIGRVEWGSAQVSTAHLVSFFVTPHMEIFTSYNDPTRQKIEMTPTRYASRFFRYWRGSMIYRLKIVGTQFHKGRLQISWDPEDEASGTSDLETTNITRVVDLDSTREIEFVVPFKAVRAWNSTSFADAGGLPIKYGGGAWGRVPNRTEHNGAITISVQNQLSAPVDPSAVQIVIFARAGPDFELAGPCENIRHYSSNPIQGPETLDGGPIEDETEVTAFTVGERTSSLRQLLHRTMHYGIFPRLVTTEQEFPETETCFFTVSHFPKLPQGYGYADDGLFWHESLVDPETSAAVNLVNETPLNTFANCFAGYRGSVNWHVLPHLVDANDQPNLSVGKYHGPELYTNLHNTPALYFTPRNMLQSYYGLNIMQNVARLAVETTVTTTGGRVRNLAQGGGGLSVSQTRIEPFVSVNVPQYHGIRFQPAFERTRDYVTPTDRVYDGFRVESMQFETATRNKYYSLFVSAGVDFNLFYFICCPPMYNYDLADVPP